MIIVRTLIAALILRVCESAPPPKDTWVDINLHFQNLTFNDDLLDSKSSKFVDLKESLESMLIRPLEAELNDSFVQGCVLGFSSGSVIAEATVLVQNELDPPTTISDALMSITNSSDFEDEFELLPEDFNVTGEREYEIDRIS
ncbi:uncharacterized protein LOC143017643 [Oratosquilla oratoria]|uniref:uncharacterized protein LOC143017643 n=1 Tax=Oratosquilla oratoria TaxID=337810 RepID=UPI003F766E7F